MNKTEKIALLIFVATAVYCLWGEVQTRQPEVITYPVIPLEKEVKEYDKSRIECVGESAKDSNGTEADESESGQDIEDIASTIYVYGQSTAVEWDGTEFIEDSPEPVSEEPEQYDTGEVGGSGDNGCTGSEAGGCIEGSEGGTEEPEEVWIGDDGLTYLGAWTATAYCPCEICCGVYSSGYTASGTYATEGRTVACNSLPMGTEVMIDGNVYVVEDTGWSPYGENWIDIFFWDHDSALAYGMRTVDVYLVG